MPSSQQCTATQSQMLNNHRSSLGLQKHGPLHQPDMDGRAAHEAPSLAAEHFLRLDQGEREFGLQLCSHY